MALQTGHTSASMRDMTDDFPLSTAAVAVVGAGAMGSGIAQIAAQAGHEVHLVDAFDGAAAAAANRLAAILARLGAKGRITLAQAEAATAKLHIAGSTADLPVCGLVEVLLGRRRWLRYGPN